MPESCNDYRVFLVYFIHVLIFRMFFYTQSRINNPLVYKEQKGGDRHADCCNGHEDIHPLPVNNGELIRKRKQHKSKLAHLRKGKCKKKVLIERNFENFPGTKQDSEFYSHYCYNQANNN